MEKIEMNKKIGDVVARALVHDCCMDMVNVIVGLKNGIEKNILDVDTLLSLDVNDFLEDIQTLSSDLEFFNGDINYKGYQRYHCLRDCNLFEKIYRIAKNDTNCLNVKITGEYLNTDYKPCLLNFNYGNNKITIYRLTSDTSKLNLTLANNDILTSFNFDDININSTSLDFFNSNDSFARITVYNE